VFRIAAVSLRAGLRCIALPLCNAVVMAVVVRVVLDYARPHLAGDLGLLTLGAAVGALLYALLVLMTQREFVASFYGLRRQA
jgi:succinoglycan exporter